MWPWVLSTDCMNFICSTLKYHVLPSLLFCINLFHQTKTKHQLFWINSTTRKHRSRFGLNRSTKNSTYLTNEIHKTWCNTQNCLQLHVHGGHIFPRLIQIFSCQIWWGLWEYSSASHRRLNKKTTWDSEYWRCTCIRKNVHRYLRSTWMKYERMNLTNHETRLGVTRWLNPDLCQSQS